MPEPNDSQTSKPIRLDVTARDRSKVTQIGKVEISQDSIGNTIINGQLIIIETQRPIKKKETSTEAKIGPNPYKGLLYFDETDSDRYFGREAQIKKLWEIFNQLHQQEESLRLLPILGPSGCGKSSLARAGLIPSLARRPLPARKKARVAILTPGTHPIEALAGVLAKIATNDIAPVTKTRELTKELKISSDSGEYDGLRRIADLLPDINSSPLIVLVDQFEEVYSLCKDTDARQAFIENLLHAAGDRAARVSVILTLRSDFLVETQKHIQLSQAITRQGFIVPAMSKEELRDAISLPAERAGYPLDKGTINQLIEQTEGREGALPLLQFALEQIWEGIRENKEPAQTLQEIGGVGGALAGKAQSIFDGLSKDEKVIARRVFLGLVQLGEGAKDTRRRTKIQSLVANTEEPQQVKKVIGRFASINARLITLSSGEGTETAEVTHEALFYHWQELNEWLGRNRDDIRFQRRLEEAARHWHENKRPGGSLWRSPDLDLLQQYHKRNSNDLTSLQLQFFQASQRADKTRKLLSVLLMVGLLVGIIWANIQRLEAIRQTKIATLRAKAIEAENLISTNPVEGLVKAMAAIGERTQYGLATELPRVHFSLSETIDAAKARDKVVMKGHTSSVNSVVISPDGKSIASASGDKTVRLWDLSGNQLAIMTGHTRSVNSVVISPDGKSIASASDDNTVRLWDLSGNQLAIMTGHTEPVMSVVISPDGKSIASASYDNTVRLWDLSGNQLAIMKGNTEPVMSVVISPDGKSIASASGDKTVRLWDLSGNQLAIMTGHTEPVMSVVISPDGKSIASASDDNTVRLWLFNWPDLLTLACNRLRYHSLLLEVEIENTEDTENDAKKAGDTCLKYSSWNNTKKAEFQRDRALAISRKGDYKQGASELKEAKKRDSTIDLNPRTKEIDRDPKKVVKQLAAPVKVKEGERLAKEGKVEEAIAAYKQAQQLNSDIDLDPKTKAIDKDSNAVAIKWAAPAKVKEGERLAKEGQVTEAIATYKEAQQLNPEIDLNPNTEEVDRNPEKVAKQLAAPVILQKAIALAEQEKIDEAIALFQKAKKFSPEIDLNPRTKEVDRNPEKVAKQLAAPVIRQKAIALAEQEKIDEAIALFQKAQKLSPEIDLNPKTEEIETDPEAVAKQLAATVMLQQARRLVNNEEIEKALALYNKAIELNPKYTDAYNERANIFYEQNKWDKALAGYNKAIESDSNYVYAYFNRGLVYKILGRKDLARESWQKAAELYKKEGKTEKYQITMDQIKSLDSD
ncbi:MAG: tetratricopeptide repeat protein [Prochloraceae cyanobacterium]|nr:tetratricopeptide repeat protein [Prochloraceae cyanobacterium]